MAHTFSQNTTHTSSVANPTTVNLTTVVGETVVVLMLKTVGGTDRVGGPPTLGGRTMTQANVTQKAASAPEAGCELWYLTNPPVGALVCSIPNTNAATLYHMLATAKAGAGMQSVFDQANGGHATSTNPTPGAITTTEDGNISFAITAGGWTTWAPSAQVGTILNNTDDGADGCGRQYHLQATKGALTLSWTFATSDDWGAVVASFKEVPDVDFENYMAVRCSSAGIVSVGERIR